jgi:hypothetical protein
MVIATSLKELIEPGEFPIVAELEVKDIDPKLESVVRLHRNKPQTSGRSTIHSAELLAAPETDLEVVYVCDPSVIVVVKRLVLDEYVTDAETESPAFTVKPEIVTEAAV